MKPTMQNAIAITIPTIFCTMATNCESRLLQNTNTQNKEEHYIPVTGIHLTAWHSPDYKPTEQDIEDDKNDWNFGMKPGDSWKLVANIEPANATNKQVIWKSEDPTIATVNQDGTVTGIEHGYTKIIATTLDKNLTATRTVHTSSGDCDPGYWNIRDLWRNTAQNK